MASLEKRLPFNVPGELFVDSTCINCDACRQLAPGVFADSGEYSYVSSQPATEEVNRKALRALLACPTGSIGTVHDNNAREVMHDFPLVIEDDVYYCGFNSPKSYGGNSYFVRYAEGNWLIDSPKFLPQLMKKFEEVGGISYIFLTHRDDVADAAKYAQRFRSQRIIHRAELDAQPDAERILEGNEPVSLSAKFVAVPTIGHTRGHCVLLYRNRFLFTGDHLWWSREDRQLEASEDYCWYSWIEQTTSMARLQKFTFEWVLPGHGQPVTLPVREMKKQLVTLVERMRV